MLVFDREQGVSDLAPVWHFVGRRVHYFQEFLAGYYYWVLPRGHHFVQVLHRHLEVLHCRALIDVAELQLLQDWKKSLIKKNIHKIIINCQRMFWRWVQDFCQMGVTQKLVTQIEQINQHKTVI